MNGHGFIDAETTLGLLSVAMPHLPEELGDFNWVSGKFSGFELKEGFDIREILKYEPDDLKFQLALTKHVSHDGIDTTNYTKPGLSLSKLFSPRFGEKLLYRNYLDIRKTGLVKILYDGDSDEDAELFFAAPGIYPITVDEWAPLLCAHRVFPRTVLVVHHGGYQEIAFSDLSIACDSDTPNAHDILFNQDKVLSIIKERNLVPFVVLGIDNDGGDDDDFYQCVNLVYCLERRGSYELQMADACVSHIPETVEPMKLNSFWADLSVALKWKTGKKSQMPIELIEFVDWDKSKCEARWRKHFKEKVCLKDALDRVKAIAKEEAELLEYGVYGMRLSENELHVKVQHYLDCPNDKQWSARIFREIGGSDVVLYIIVHGSKRSLVAATFTRFRNSSNGFTMSKTIGEYIRKEALRPVFIQTVDYYDGEDENDFELCAIHCFKDDDIPTQLFGGQNE